MSGPGARRIAHLLLGLLDRLAPRGLRMWVAALRAEAAQVPGDMEALRFVAASALGLLAIFAKNALSGAGHDALGRPRGLAALAATGAVGLGGVHMIAAGAPAAMLLVNGMALVLGLLVLGATARGWSPSREGAEIAMVVIAAVLLATGLFGVAAHGAVRWVAVGPLMIQPSLILLPLLLMLFARTATATGSLALGIAALAIALQLDRALAGALVAGLAALWAAHRAPPVSLALAASAIGLLVTLARPENLPAAAYSDGIFATAWQVHPLLGLAVWSGATLLLLPCAVRGAGGGRDEGSRAVFGVTWLAIILAAALGQHPAPLVGYGGSAILGYLLAAGLLPRGRQGRSTDPASHCSRRRDAKDMTPLLPRSASCA